MGDGREGDWECGGCRNRNYAFRSFCNRCKQPRLLMDTKTPPDSKWLPRIGDWICTGCTNNNYASREKCKKCGQPKEVAAIPALAMPGASLSTHPPYFAQVSGAMDQSSSLLAFSNPINQAPVVPKGWRNGDWICCCGFHNYSSRLQCKNCNEAAPPALGTKRLASEALAHEWDSKRLNQGYASEPQLGIYASYAGISSARAPSFQASLSFLQQASTPTLLGKGAKQWRSGDWMCTNCNNHNYASRSECNRCKTQRDVAPPGKSPVES